MIYNFEVDLLKANVDGIIHQANCFNTMNSGIARYIRETYPEAYEADCKTTAGDIHKLGKFSFVKTNDNRLTIYNCYSQFRYGREQRHTNYEAIYTGLSSILIHAESRKLQRLGLPYNMGCVLGGGSWHIVRAIIEEVFDKSTVDLHICRYTT